MKEITTFLIVAGLSIAVSQEYGGGHALFIRTPFATAHSRIQRAASVSVADVMAHNILEWIQGIYRQGARKPRQQSDSPGYLPPYSTQRPPEKPRPFQAPSTGQQPSYTSTGQNEVTNYPYQRPSSGFSPSSIGSQFGQSSTVQPSPFSTQKPTFFLSTLPPNSQSSFGSPSYNPHPNATPSYSNSASSVFPPYSSTLRPSTTGQISGGVSTNYDSYGSPPAVSTLPTPSGFSTTYGYMTQRPSPTYVPSAKGPASARYPPATYDYLSGRPSSPFPSTPDYTSSRSTVEEVSGPSIIETSSGVAESVEEGSSSSGTDTKTMIFEDDLKHPPHIHALDVQCSKTTMIIHIEFNRVFDGVIYSKGFFMNPECRYVKQNSRQTKYSFTVSLNSCGTQFINDFAGEAGQAYLENVLVLQNEPGIQEIWDTVRRVRCLWEGNINKALTVNFAVDMLNQEIVTFSGDTAVAKLDIQVGRGPFAPAADGLVKIGETMTLVVTVEGDPAFDLQVRDCLARDESATNRIHLTDTRGCILKPKLFGAFQKTKDTGNTGASIIAYAYFQAFKFPDVMDLFIECNVELCKTDCEPCSERNQQIEPGRRRRSVIYTPSNGPSNGSAVLLSDPVRVTRGFRVIMVDDLSKASNQVLEQLETTAIEEIEKSTTNVCIPYTSFYTVTSFLLTIVLITTISAVILYVKLQQVYRSKTIYF
ncbi:unnamed protein product [Xylocopa violacea]|uniref:ZP domain-containing protein n=1 Tax=Xylocopa violacea TaxID=135666 RepID=A0ABP1N952_XYLVO